MKRLHIFWNDRARRIAAASAVVLCALAAVRWVRVGGLALAVTTALLLAQVLVPIAFAAQGAPPPIPNVFGMTLVDFIWWIVGDSVLGVAVAFLLVQVGVPEQFRAILMTGALGAAAWIVRQFLPFVPEGYLDKTLWELLFLVVGGLVSWLVGVKPAALWILGRLRRVAGVSTLSIEAAAKLAAKITVAEKLAGL